MKALAIIISLFLAGLAWSQEVPAKPESDKNEPQLYCPKTLISDMDKCFRCHVAPSFKVLESKPDECRVYPTGNMKVVVTEQRKTAGYLLLQNIDSDPVKAFLDYLSVNAIDYAIIEIHSPGGSLLDAWRIVGLMQAWERPGRIIETRCHGFAASAGFLVFVSGTKGSRFASETAEMMWHELSLLMFKIETPSGSEESALILRHLQDTANEWIASRGNMSKEDVDAKVRKKEFWLRGSEAKELGFVDAIIGVK